MIYASKYLGIPAFANDRSITWKKRLGSVSLGSTIWRSGMRTVGESGNEDLRKKVEELEKKIEAIVTLINATNQVFMRLFDTMMAHTERMISLLEQLPESVAKAYVNQWKKDIKEMAEMLEKIRKSYKKSIYVV